MSALPTDAIPAPPPPTHVWPPAAWRNVVRDLQRVEAGVRISIAVEGGNVVMPAPCDGMVGYITDDRGEMLQVFIPADRLLPRE